MKPHPWRTVPRDTTTVLIFTADGVASAWFCEDWDGAPCEPASGWRIYDDAAFIADYDEVAAGCYGWLENME